MLLAVDFDGEVVVSGFEAGGGVGRGLGEVPTVEAGDEVAAALEGFADGEGGVGVGGVGVVGVAGCWFLWEEEGEGGGFCGVRAVVRWWSGLLEGHFRGE